MSITTAKDRLSSLVDELNTTLVNTYSITLSDQQLTELKRVSGVWLDNSQYKSLTLSDNKPDFNQILLQFQNALEHEDAWRDTITAGAGQALLRFVSAAVAYTAFAQERSTQERYSYIARLPSSIFAATRSLGVRITRRKPASVKVNLLRPGNDALVIPAFTSFTVGTTKFFNRKVISFGKGNIFAVEAELTQGEVFIDTYKSPGQPFVTYEVGHGDGTISEDDIYFYVNEEEYTRVTDGFFGYGPNDKVFYENTMANGNIEVIAGSGNYGVMPPSNADIKIRYATTLGVEAESSVVELPVLCPDFTIVTGSSNTPISGANSPRSTEFYRINAPYMRAMGERAVIRRDYDLQAINYSGLIIHDARSIGQQEIAPGKKWAQGLIKICPLTDVLLDDTQWLQFRTYMEGKAIEGFTILKEDPVAKSVNIGVRLGINANYALESSRLAAVAALRNAYAPTQGSLGRAFYRNDISTILLTANDPALNGAINWIEIDTPTETTVAVAWNEYVKVDSLSVVTEYTSRNYSNRIGFDTAM